MKKLIIFLFVLILLVSFMAADSDWTVPNYWTLDNGTITTIFDVFIENLIVVNSTVTNYEVNGTITSTDWSNVTINESQVLDLNHTETFWNRSGTNTYLINTGDDVGIGTTTPDYKLELEANFALFDGIRLTDADGGHFSLGQGTGAAGHFQPTFEGKATGANRGSLIFKGLESTGGVTTNPVIAFVATNAPNTAPVADNKIIFGFKNRLTQVVTILGSGDFGINEVAPSCRLDVVGDICSTDWSDVSITETQVSDLTHTIDTNTNCSTTGICPTVPYLNYNNTGDFIVNGTVFASAINISNSSFSLTADENNSINFFVKNQNNGSNATALITTLNDAGEVFGIGIASTNYVLGDMLKPNITAVFSRSRGEMLFINTFRRPFVWYSNPSDDDNLSNLVEAMRLDEDNLNVSRNITAQNVFLPQYIFPHNNETIPVNGANAWTNISFIQEDVEIKQGISHTYNDDTNTTFTINEDGIYYISFNYDVIDTSPSASDIDIAGRVIWINKTEIQGSVFETDITKQQIETELSHEMLARLNAGDKILFQFTADDGDVEISTHGTFGDHPDSVSVIIEKRYNLP